MTSPLCFSLLVLALCPLVDSARGQTEDGQFRLTAISALNAYGFESGAASSEIQSDATSDASSSLSLLFKGNPGAPQVSGAARRALIMAAIVGYMMLVLFNIYYDYAHPEMPPKLDTQADRALEWDVVKFVLMTGVITFHCAGYLNTEEDLKGPDWLLGQALLRPVVPCFVFVSGMFGTRVSKSSLMKAPMFAWPCILLMVAISILRLFPALGIDVHSFNGYGFWYLWCLAAWRLTIAPLFYYTQHSLNVPTVATWFLMSLAAHAALHMTYHGAGPIWSDVWRCYLFFAPLFGAGIAFSPRSSGVELTKTMPRLCLLFGSVYVVIWYALLFQSPEFRRWNVSYCVDHDTCALGNYGIPNSYGYQHKVDANYMVVDMQMGLLQLGIVLAWLCVLVSFARALGHVPLSHISLLAGWGSRSLVAYVLHSILLEIMKAAGLYCIDWLPASLKLGFCILIACQASALLSCRGTEHLFRWILVPPLFFRKGTSDDLP